MVMKSRIVAVACAMLGFALPAVAQQFGSPELIAAAKKEGRLVYYTANVAEAEQQVIKAFNKRFPEIKVEMVRASGGQLITRVKTEAAAGKLTADVVDHSDRSLRVGLLDLFPASAPPTGGGHADRSVREWRPEDGGASERRQAVSQLEPVRGRPDLHDQGAGQPDFTQEAAGLSGRVRSQGGQDLAAEVRGLREAALRLGRGVEQDLQLPAIGRAKPMA